MTFLRSSLPRSLYRAAQVQQLDRMAIEQCGIEGFSLMQRAGSVCFQALQERWPEARQLLVFAGGGNNAGDACIVAGLAQEQGLSVQLVHLREPESLAGDARLAWQWAVTREVTMLSFEDLTSSTEPGNQQTVIVDGLLGTGLDREISGTYAEAIAWINNDRSPVLAIDIPSGLNADTGMPMGSAVHGDLTVSFIGLKQGLLTGVAGNHVGELVFSDLDVPPEVYTLDPAPRPETIRIDINSAVQQLPVRDRAAHKGLFGHVLVVGGDYGFGGAVSMAAEAAQRTGAGLVSVLTRSGHRAAILARRPELMVAGTEDADIDIDSLVAKATVIVVGPGLGTGDWSRAQLQCCLSTQLNRNIPLIIDADGLNLLAERGQTGDHQSTQLKRDNWILTPHPGETARLLQCSKDEISQDRFAAIRRLQEKWGGHCLLKGHGSLIIGREDKGTVFLCSEGNAGMASGGMGDVLAGVIGGLVAQRLEPGPALRMAACIHGEAADLAAGEGERGLLATDLLPFIRQLVNANY